MFKRLNMCVQLGSISSSLERRRTKQSLDPSRNKSIPIHTLSKLTMSNASTNNITNRDGGAEVTDDERITAEGNRLLKRFVRAVGTIATNGCRIDSALLKDFSEVKIECIANLMQEDKKYVRFGIKSVVEKFVKCKCRVSTRCAPVIILTLTHQCATITTIL
jgi:hypothetical protein